MIILPTLTLPTEPTALFHALRSYFSFDLWPVWEIRGGNIYIELLPPPKGEHYIDPALSQGLRWWGPDTTITEIPKAFRPEPGFLLALNDAWVLLSWSRWIERQLSEGTDPRAVVVLHADDHEDLMSPRLVIGGPHEIIDPITGSVFDLRKPCSVASAIRSGAIGMGSFLTPLVHTLSTVEVRHLKAHAPTQPLEGLTRSFETDSLLRPGALRIATVRTGRSPMAGESSYSLTSAPEIWIRELPRDVPVLIHIDMDYFNNRFNCDTDWESLPDRHDPPEPVVLEMVDRMFDAIVGATDASNVVDIAVAVSPGFCPAELWGPITTRVRNRVRQLVVRSSQDTHSTHRASIQGNGEYNNVMKVHLDNRNLKNIVPPRNLKDSVRYSVVSPLLVHLKRSQGSKGRGGGVGASYWHVYYGDIRAGYIYINVIDEAPVGRHASIQIQLNQKSRGMGIGSIAYKLAADSSGHDKVYAHMRKSNVASRHAAENAGFMVVEDPAISQCLMIWERTKR